MSSAKSVKPIILTADSAELEQSLAELRRLSEPFPQVVNSLFGSAFKFSDLFGVDLVNGSASGTGENRIVFKPTPFLMGYMAALVAVERENHVVVK